VRAAGLMAPDAAEAMARRLLDANALAEAETVLRQALARDAERAASWALLGRIRHARGDRDAAVDFLRKALALDPKHVAAHNDLGIFLQAQGRLTRPATGALSSLTVASPRR